MATERTPLHSSQSNPAERHIRDAEDQVRILRVAVAERYGRNDFGADHDAWPWLLMHATETWAKFHVRGNRTTAYHDLHGCEYKGELVEFLEQ
eukprot:6871867-Lingulodinium_polyedra.AAC.1